MGDVVDLTPPPLRAVTTAAPARAEQDAVAMHPPILDRGDDPVATFMRAWTRVRERGYPAGFLVEMTAGELRQLLDLCFDERFEFWSGAGRLVERLVPLLDQTGETGYVGYDVAYVAVPRDARPWLEVTWFQNPLGIDVALELVADRRLLRIPLR